MTNVAKQFSVTGMSCAACQAHVEKTVAQIDDVTSVTVSLLTNTMSVEGSASADAIIAAVRTAGYDASLKDASVSASAATAGADDDPLADRDTPRLLRRFAVSLVVLFALMVLTMGHLMAGLPLPRFLAANPVGFAFAEGALALIILLLNRAFFLSGSRSLAHGAPNMDTLVALGSGIAFGWSLVVFYRLTGLAVNGASTDTLWSVVREQLYFETAAMVPVLITFGKTLEAFSKGKTTNALRSLLKLTPKTAVVVKDGREATVPVSSVAVGDVFIVRPGASVPVDGTILTGTTSVDESALTGESLPVDKAIGAVVRAATLNLSGCVTARADRVGTDTTFAQIVKLVTDAEATKAPIARLADVASGIFVPVILFIAVVTAVGWLVAGASVPAALERAIAVLVIACPCALGLATPVAIMVASGVGARHGLLFKTGAALENAGRVRLIALDKTGTVTEGKPVVTDVCAATGVTETKLLELAVALERNSAHPLARAVVAYGEKKDVTVRAVSDFRSLTGHGVSATIEAGGDLSEGASIAGQRKGCWSLIGGSLAFISESCAVDATLQAKAEAWSAAGKTPLAFAAGKRVLGLIAVADTLKADSVAAI